MRYCLFFLLYIVLFNFLIVEVSASDYVMPYPSVMPGNFRYKIHVMFEEIQKYWYFGSFAKFKYNLKLADKYLIESKTLFEYKQFLLAYKALIKSNSYYSKISFYIQKAKNEGKDVTNIKMIYYNASQKHKEILINLKNALPKEYIWQPENSKDTELPLHAILDKSIELRNRK